MFIDFRSQTLSVDVTIPWIEWYTLMKIDASK